MSNLWRWTGPLDSGPFRFKPTEGAFRSLTLRSRDGRMVDPDGRDFCTPEEIDSVASSTWRGLRPIVVEEEDGPGLYVLWINAQGIEDPETFRARMLGGRAP
jgi:hypothetical protein